MGIKLYSKELLKQAPNGIFLTGKNDDKTNTMTIGWASVVVLWGKPILLILVNPSAYTCELINNTNKFTISVPKYNKMKEELDFYGTHSGRYNDKYTECELSITESKEIDVPVIKECEIFYECKVIHRDNLQLNETIKNSEDEIPIMFYGEIVRSYK